MSWQDLTTASVVLAASVYLLYRARRALSARGPCTSCPQSRTSKKGPRPVVAHLVTLGVPHGEEK